jgi:hypothetical protein
MLLHRHAAAYRRGEIIDGDVKRRSASLFLLPQ